MQVVFGVARPESKLRRCQRQLLQNEIAIEAHHHAVFIDVGTRYRQLLATARLEKTQSLCFENGQRAIDNAFQLLIAENCRRPVRIYDVTPRQLLDLVRYPLLPMPSSRHLRPLPELSQDKFSQKSAAPLLRFFNLVKTVNVVSLNIEFRVCQVRRQCDQQIVGSIIF